MFLRTYVQRLRMEMSLRRLPEMPRLPHGFELVPWDAELLEAHAEVKWLSFRDTTDALIFPNLGRIDGCITLMGVVTSHQSFAPEAAWLMHGPEGYCGCIQGIRGERQQGAIQNIGVVPECRGQGIGRALLMAALHGFRDVGMTRVNLEVCARNIAAVRLYHNIGFQIHKTLYRETREELAEFAI